MCLDEPAARRNFGTHEHGERLIRCHGIGKVDLQECPSVRIHCCFPQLFRIHFTQTLVTLDVRFLSRGCAELFELIIAFIIGIGIADFFTGLDLVKRRLRDINMAFRDQFRHIAEEEGQQQRADVAAVNVRIGHDDDAVIAQVFHVEVFIDTGADGGDQRGLAAVDY